MADSFYSYGLGLLQSGGINWVSDTIGVALVSAMSYQFGASHQYYSAIEDAVLAVGLVPTKTAVAGSVNSDPISLYGVDTDQTGQALVFYRETFDAATSELISYHDTTLGLPCSPDGNPLLLVLPHGPEGLFNYLSSTFGAWEGLRGVLQAQNSPAPCGGSVGRYVSF